MTDDAETPADAETEITLPVTVDATHPTVDTGSDVLIAGAGNGPDTTVEVRTAFGGLGVSLRVIVDGPDGWQIGTKATLTHTDARRLAGDLRTPLDEETPPVDAVAVSISVDGPDADNTLERDAGEVAAGRFRDRRLVGVSGGPAGDSLGNTAVDGVLKTTAALDDGETRRLAAALEHAAERDTEGDA